MEQELIKKLDSLEQKIDEGTRQITSMRRYFMWTLIISAAVIILPIIGLIIAIPQFLNTYQGLGL